MNNIVLSEHHMQCERCGDYFDMRDLNAVVRHETCERSRPFIQGEKIEKVEKDELSS